MRSKDNKNKKAWREIAKIWAFGIIGWVCYIALVFILGVPL